MLVQPNPGKGLQFISDFGEDDVTVTLPLEDEDALVAFLVERKNQRDPELSCREVRVTEIMVRGETLLEISQMLDEKGLTTKRAVAISTALEYANQKGLRFELDYERVLDHIYQYPEMFKEWFASKYQS